jgi:hypothetical protein
MAQTSNPTPEQQPTPSPQPRPTPHQEPAPTPHQETPTPPTPTQAELDAMARGEYNPVTAQPPEAPEAAQKRERDALEARHKREREELERQHRDVRPGQSGPGYTTR